MIHDAKRHRIDDQAIEEEQEDRISNLPRHLIDNILNRMPICDVARTSVLSKTWKNIWETHPYINISFLFLYQRRLFGLNVEARRAARPRYLDIVNSILLAHKGPILEFSLVIPYFDSDLHETPYPYLWIKQLPEKGVRALNLENEVPNLAQNIPSYFFSFSHLTRLSLVNWKLNPPRSFKGFRYLTTINLQRVFFTTAMSFGTQVQHLKLWFCAGIEHLDLQLTSHGKNIKLLVIVRNVNKENRFASALGYNPCTDMTKSFNLRRLLGNMPSIETLELNGTSLKFLDPGLTLHNHLTSTMDNLKTLRLNNIAVSNVRVISNTFCLLRSMPVLERLEIIMDHDIKSGSDITLSADQYLELPGCVSIILNQLQNVIIHNVMGSRTENLFIKFLLASSPSLRRMTLVRNTILCNRKEISRIEQELSQFSRKSPVEIFWRS